MRICVSVILVGVRFGNMHVFLFCDIISIYIFFSIKLCTILLCDSLPITLRSKIVQVVY